MDPREPAWTSPDPPETTSAAAARARLVTELRHRGSGLSRSVQDAFARVPRHVFVPEVGAAAAYRDEAFVIKCGPDGMPVSSSSQPAMMAIMLDQLGLRPGHRVLEIGTGSGYNAAVMAAVVGHQGEVVSIDIDADLVARARSSLVAAGYGAVTVRCADGGFGDPTGAPFDRIIVTAGAWDIAPAWLDQLVPGGRLVLPLSVRAIQLSVALERAGEAWRSTSAWRCGFVRMMGAFAGPERVLTLDEPRALYVQMSDGSPVDGPGLQRALAGPATDVPVNARLVGLADLPDLDLWLSVTSADLARLIILAAPGSWLGLAPLLPVGGLVGHAADPEQLGVGLLLPAELARGGQALPGAVFSGFGPGGPAVASRLAEQASHWAALGRPGAGDMQLTVWPAAAAPAAVTSAPVTSGSVTSGSVTSGSGPGASGGLVLRRPSVTIEVGWPPG
jgi:protein-L-isoaspartate(D-aspartate) O-methyltransferase